MNNPIRKGSIVLLEAGLGSGYATGHYKVRALFKKTANLGSVFGSKTTVKKVPLELLKEDRDAWYEEWTKSETYMSM